MNEKTEAAGRKNREEWVALMAVYEAGDLSQREFCERHELAYSTFGYWRKQLCSPAVKPVRPSEPLLELSPLVSNEATEWRVQLDLGCGVMLRVR